MVGKLERPLDALHRCLPSLCRPFFSSRSSLCSALQLQALPVQQDKLGRHQQRALRGARVQCGPSCRSVFSGHGAQLGRCPELFSPVDEAAAAAVRPRPVLGRVVRACCLCSSDSAAFSVVSYSRFRTRPRSRSCRRERRDLSGGTTPRSFPLANIIPPPAWWRRCNNAACSCSCPVARRRVWIMPPVMLTARTTPSPSPSAHIYQFENSRTVDQKQSGGTRF